MKTIEINGVTYEVINSHTKRAKSIMNSMSRAERHWRHLYKSPSDTKQSIKEYWEKTLIETAKSTGDEILDIRYTGNCMTFSIYAESDTAYYYITKSHNYIIPLPVIEYDDLWR